MNTKTIYALSWTEFESGWGCRPDGLQVFTSYDELEKVLERDRKERESAKYTPSCYSIPEVKYILMVNDADFKAIEKLVGKTCTWFGEAGKRDIEFLMKTYPSMKKIGVESL
jgi:hypothetical protein